MTKKLEATKIKLYECVTKGNAHPKVLRRLASKIWNIEHRNDIDDKMRSALQSHKEYVREVAKTALTYHRIMDTLDTKVDNIFKDADGKETVTIEHLINEICRWSIKILSTNSTIIFNEYARKCAHALDKYKPGASLYELMYCKELEGID